MKKSVLIVAALVAVSFASCRKDRTCVCTSTDSAGNKTETTLKAKSTKKDGEAWCSGAQSATTTYNGVAVTGGGSSETCAIK